MTQTTTRSRPAFVDAMFDDDEWNQHVAAVGIIGARTELCQMKGQLRVQRRSKVGTDEYPDFLRKQAGFDRMLSQRLAEIEAVIAANPEGSGKRYRQRITELTELIAALAFEIDETDLEYLLDDYTVPLGEDRITLAEAIDTGRIVRPAEPEDEAVAS